MTRHGEFWFDALSHCFITRSMKRPANFLKSFQSKDSKFSHETSLFAHRQSQQSFYLKPERKCSFPSQVFFFKTQGCIAHLIWFTELLRIILKIASKNAIRSIRIVRLNLETILWRDVKNKSTWNIYLLKILAQFRKYGRTKKLKKFYSKN